ncbi:MAG: hypothetical protein Kow002_08310 [Anaerolineales bacterium]
MLLTSILFSGLLYFLPAMLAGFPVFDGGLFYTMSEDLKAHQFILPAFTQYNLAGIPFAYPPLGFYVTALISTLFRIPALEILRWLPPLVSVLSLFAFYWMASEVLRSKLQAALATAFYGLLLDSLEWAIMGGGITRSFGFLFMFLTITSANRFFSQPRGLLAARTAVFGALAFLSHPETGLLAGSMAVLLWFFRGRSKETFIRSVFIAFGVAILSAPWWWTVLSRHGLAPFLSAAQTSDDGTFHLAKLLVLNFSDGVFFNLTLAIGLVGLLAALAKKQYLLPLWWVLPFFIDPRGAGSVSAMAVAMLAGYGFDVLLAPALLALRSRTGAWHEDRFVVNSLLLIMLYLFFGSGLSALDLAGKSLSAADQKTMTWIDQNIPPESDLLLITGEQYSMNDPFQEWFPALTRQRSHTTLQGAEWTLAEEFFPFYGELVALQHCADLACVDEWGARTGVTHQYLLIKKIPRENALHASLTSLLRSVRQSPAYELVYEQENAVLFIKNER